jgi:AAHS family 4-hydroxybenzoate transporter-like MFS transporter
MSGAYASAAETALEGQRIGSLQIRVAILCALAQGFDGYDISSIGMAAPSLSHAWNVTPAAFASAFVMSNVGVMVGALASGPAGDRRDANRSS